MGKLFGTDGIRGRANSYPVTAETALLVSKAAAKFFSVHKSHSGRVKAVLGKDTRLSGYMLENSISAGLLSMGVDVLAVGPMPTPAVAHLVRSFAADFGIMITASHNPACDNGIKIFDGSGTHAAHLTYAGDSVLGSDVNLGAGTVISNLRHDNCCHRSMVNGELIVTGRRKFGAVIGDGVHTGINTSIYPGRKLSRGVSTRPGEIVSKDI